MQSTIKLGLWEGAKFPDYCAWANKNRRSISAGFYKEFIYISFKTNNFCYLRCLQSHPIEVALMIASWLDKKMSIKKFKKRFPEVEVFKRFFLQKKDNDPKKEQGWNNIKNHFFAGEYSSEGMYFNNCIQILNIAKTDPVLKHFQPYSSIGRVCFREWNDNPCNFLCIAPKRWEPVNGNFFLTLPPDEKKVDVNSIEEGLTILKNCIEQLPYNRK